MCTLLPPPFSRAAAVCCLVGVVDFGRGCAATWLDTPYYAFHFLTRRDVLASCQAAAKPRLPTHGAGAGGDAASGACGSGACSSGACGGGDPSPHAAPATTAAALSLPPAPAPADELPPLPEPSPLAGGVQPRALLQGGRRLRRVLRLQRNVRAAVAAQRQPPPQQQPHGATAQLHGAADGPAIAGAVIANAAAARGARAALAAARSRAAAAAAAGWHAAEEAAARAREEEARRRRLEALRRSDMAAYKALLAESASEGLQAALSETEAVLATLAKRLGARARSAMAAGGGGGSDGDGKGADGAADDGGWEGLAGRLPAAAAVERQPALLEGGTLRPYQLHGLRWMAGLLAAGLNGILADE